MKKNGVKKNKVLSDAQYVASESRHVSINDERIKAFCDSIREKPSLQWNHELHFNDNTARTADYILTKSALNYCFWPQAWAVKYNNQKYTGYWALAASLKRAIEHGADFDAKYLAGFSLRDARRLFSGHGQIPLIKSRVRNLQEIGSVLKENDYDFAQVIRESKNDALALVDKIVALFSSFNDTSIYNNQCVRFHKRAQILVGELHMAFSGKGLGRFKNISELTIFADYKLPQIMRSRGILEYSPSLSSKVDNQKMIKAGSSQEVEIRANTVAACDRITDTLSKRFNIIPIELDNYLWNLAKKHGRELRPYHRTLTTFY